jgi:hypothetical protein
MKLEAKDTIHVSNVRQEPFERGEKFEIEKTQGADLVKRGLALEVKAPAPGNGSNAVGEQK